jgi:predicted RNA-binding Zn-ribbon protein involved in translation (DUF1610 family)
MIPYDCPTCGHEMEASPYRQTCPECGDTLKRRQQTSADSA